MDETTQAKAKQLLCDSGSCHTDLSPQEVQLSRGSLSGEQFRPPRGRNFCLKVIKFSLCLPRTRFPKMHTQLTARQFSALFFTRPPPCPLSCLLRFLFESQTTEDHVGTGLDARYPWFIGRAT